MCLCPIYHLEQAQTSCCKAPNTAQLNRQLRNLNPNEIHKDKGTFVPVLNYAPRHEDASGGGGLEL